MGEVSIRFRREWIPLFQLLQQGVGFLITVVQPLGNLFKSPMTAPAVTGHRVNNTNTYTRTDNHYSYNGWFTVMKHFTDNLNYIWYSFNLRDDTGICKYCHNFSIMRPDLPRNR